MKNAAPVRPATGPAGSSYPWHDIWVPRLKGTTAMQCGGMLMLPEQVMIRDAAPGRLYCLYCKEVVNAGDGQYVRALDAANGEGFDVVVARALPDSTGPAVVPASLGKATPKATTEDLFAGLGLTKKTKGRGRK